MMERQTEARIIDACRSGDRAALQLLFESFKDQVYSIALHFAGNDELAKEISQQAFLKIFTGLKGFRADSGLTTWIYRIVANACTDEYRRRRRLIPFADERDHAAPSRECSVEDKYYRRQLSKAVREAVAGLKPKLRMVVVLKYVEGLSYQEIAEVLDCSTGTVASRLNRGHKVLAQRLSHLKGSLEVGTDYEL